MLNDDLLITRAGEAEQARTYIDSLVSSAKEQIFDRIMELQPDQTMLFTVMKSQLSCLDDVMMVVESDIRAGKEALDRVQGNPVQKGGIL